MIGCATIGTVLWGTWWAVPFFLAYGVLYGSASESRWHEAGHGTAFTSRRLDEAVYQVACFPYHRLPELHAEIKDDLAPVYPSLWAAYKEIIPAVLRQMRDETYFVRRELPATATALHIPAPWGDGRALPLTTAAA